MPEYTLEYTDHGALDLQLQLLRDGTAVFATSQVEPGSL